MQQLSNLDVFFLCREFTESLAGSRFVNFYETGGVFRFKFNNGENLLLDLKKSVFLSRKFAEAEGSPSPFVVFFRKALDNARFAKASQVNQDRILCLEFEKKEKFFVVLELFREGNILLCDSNWVIQEALNKAEYASRTLKKWRGYVHPPSGKKNVEELAQGDLPAKGPLLPMLSKAVNLSPFYLEEACFRAGLAFDEKNVSEKDANKLLESMKELFVDFFPCVYYQEEKPVAFSVCRLKKMQASIVAKAFPSLSAALAEYYSQDFEVKKQSKQDFILGQQQAALGQLAEKSLEARQKAEWIYENFTLVEKLLGKAKEGASQEELNLLSEGLCKVEKKARELVVET